MLNNVAADHGKPTPGGQHYPAGVVVDVSLWREHLLQAGILDPKAKNPRADFKRLKDQLAGRGLIGEWASLMWAVNSTEG